jgi:membrane associated rhomboid family serine protease
MIPLKDNAPRYSFPVITLTLIAVNVLVFLYQMMLSNYALDSFDYQNGVVPFRVTGFLNGRVPLDTAFAPFFTCMFLHSGWLHLIGNMWFLWIFGDNVEDSFGHFAFLVFYFVTGIAASFVQVAASPMSRIPTIGASGAIAGVMGAYLILFPRARVLTLVPFILYFTMEIPAVVMLVYWFVIQFFSGFASLGSQAASGGVAFWAHVGGFIAGMLLVAVFRRPRPQYRESYYYYNR